MIQELKEQIASVEANENTSQPPTSATTAPPEKVPPPELSITYVDELTRAHEGQTWGAFELIAFNRHENKHGRLQAALHSRCAGSLIRKTLFPDLMNHFS
jgi:hypothetical protein